MMTLTNFKEQLNLLINKALANVNNLIGSDTTQTITVANLETALSGAITGLNAAPPTVSHDRTIEEPGAALNPSLP